MRPYLFGLLTIVLFGLWWYLDNLLAARGWAMLAANDQWTLVSEGWEILLAAWPLALVGVLVGGIPAFLLVLWVWQYVEEKDHNKEIADHQKELMAAEIRATQAMAEAVAEAKRQTQAEKEEAAQLKQQAIREMDRVKQAAVGLVTMQQQAKLEVVTAQEDVERANLRARNATATGQRKAKKLATLQAQLAKSSC